MILFQLYEQIFIEIRIFRIFLYEEFYDRLHIERKFSYIYDIKYRARHSHNTPTTRETPFTMAKGVDEGCSSRYSFIIDFNVNARPG